MLTPDLVVAADWGVGAGKRWMARAVRQGDRYSLSHPVPVGEPGKLLTRIRQLAAGGSALVGFDFPIGLPKRYAEGSQRGKDFRAILASLTKEFCEPSDSPAPDRPFGPQSSSKGIFGPEKLAERLGIATGELLRGCDRKAKAGPLFYTLGPRQVGRAAAHGWQEILQPSLKDIRLWPFEGPLTELLVPGAIVVAEIYPGWFYRKLQGMPSGQGGKEAGDIRKTRWDGVLERAKAAGVRLDLTESATEWVESGFASSDDFDAMVSIPGILEALASLESLEPSDFEVRFVEGWILGLPPEPALQPDRAV